MAEQAKLKTLRAGHRKALGLEDKTEKRSAKMSQAAAAYYNRHQDLKNIPPHILRQAWFNLAHLILSRGAKVAHMGCGDGAVTHAMAKLYPELEFVGVDPDKKSIAKAKLMYHLPNLSYQRGEINSKAGFDEGALDAIINSFVLHEIFTSARYSERQVSQALEYQFNLLKPDGLMFIRDYALHYPEEYILMEMPDAPGGDDLASMSEADLLVWYSEHANPHQDPGCHGFFLEELPPRFPQTRLFRLPYKWAYEFIIRKDNRARIQKDLHKEYAFFTEGDFRKTLYHMGARALYTAPHWDENYIAKRFDGRFRLLDEQGEPLGPPPTSFLVVAQKTGEEKSLRLLERRPSNKADSRLRITSMRNEKTGRIVDIATRDIDSTDIIPYRITPEGKLHVYVHESIPRGIVNAVPRVGQDLDGKRWSGHMVEAIAAPSDILASVEKADFKEIVKFSRDYLGLKPTINAKLEIGPSYYPAPDFIDELVQTRYLQVREHEEAIIPKVVMDDIRGFTSFGRIREVSAQQILDSVSVGFIPNARLELQILTLFDHLKMKCEVWEDCPLVLEESNPDIVFDSLTFARLKAEKDDRFKPIRGSASHLRMVQSVFVDEGWKEGAATGMASRDMGFVISEEETLNRAVILPLTKQGGEVMVGFETVYMPVPQRAEGNGLHLRAPSINLPKHVTNIHQARKYVADLFKVPIENVWRMGERYYCHAGVTPMRVYPFAVATDGSKNNPIGGPVQYAPMKFIWKVLLRVLEWRQDFNLIWYMRRASRNLGMDSDQQLTHSYGKALAAMNNVAGVMSVSSIEGAADIKADAGASKPATAEKTDAGPAGKAETQPETKTDPRQDKNWHLG